MILEESESPEIVHISTPNSTPTPSVPSVPASLLMPTSSSPGPHAAPSAPARVIAVNQRSRYEPGQEVSGADVDTSCLLVHPRQTGNNALNLIRNVRWQRTRSIFPDFQFGENQCGMYISLHYHVTQRKTYIGEQLAKLPSHYVVRILFVEVDHYDEDGLMYMNNLAIIYNMTLVLAFSSKEIARYLEVYKNIEHSNADSLKETVQRGHFLLARSALSVVKSISSADVANLLHTFGTVANIMTASLEQLSTVSGLGEKKILALYNAFHGPFITSSALIPNNTSPDGKQKQQSTISSIFKRTLAKQNSNQDDTSEPPEDIL